MLNTLEKTDDDLDAEVAEVKEAESKEPVESKDQIQAIENDGEADVKTPTEKLDEAKIEKETKSITEEPENPSGELDKPVDVE